MEAKIEFFPPSKLPEQLGLFPMTSETSYHKLDDLREHTFGFSSGSQSLEPGRFQGKAPSKGPRENLMSFDLN